MLKRFFFILSVFLFSISFAQKDLSQYVNPFIGTGGHAHTFPGACYPFGMMQLSPDTRTTGWDGCSGYYYDDTIIYGFTHTHLSGTGCSDYGDILLMPVSDNTPSLTSRGDTMAVFLNNFSSSYFKRTEKASPGYYSVVLKNGNIKTDLTVGKYAGIHRYIYSKEDSCGIILDLNHRNQVLSSWFKKISDTEICGYRETKAWTKNRWIYFDIRFSKPIKSFDIYTNGSRRIPLSHSGIVGFPAPDTTLLWPKESRVKDTKVVFSFNYRDTILVKIGISAVSIEDAKENLTHDIPGWDFDGTRKKTQQAWNDYLHKIEVSTKNDSLLTTFYTAMYHTAIHPSLFTDVNGNYMGRDGKVHKADGFNMYTVFSIWDTYRSLHPLFTIIDSSMDRQFIQTFLKQYEQGGALPVWELWANETNCMIGYHSVSIIYDAYQKGIKGFDAKEALKAMQRSAWEYERVNGMLMDKGYIPANEFSESVSQTLECGYDNWCIAQMGKSLGDTSDFTRYMMTAQGYKKVFNPNNDFMQGRENERFCVPFNPTAVTFNYTEANAWQYNFYVPQDMSGLISLYGSKEKLAQKLDTLFTMSSKMAGRTQPDITGMIGQDAQGNEPSHHNPYLYNYVGQPWKTAKYVHQLEKFYTNKPDGICGNDDCGALSAWYVMSAMGLYQVCPGDGQFELTAPLFDTVKIHLENGKTFTISSEKGMTGDNDIESASLDGTDYKNSFLKYTDLMNGGKLNYTFTNTNKLSDWGTGKNVPVDSIEFKYRIEPSPYFEYGNAVFGDSLKIRVKSFTPSDTNFSMMYYVVTGPDDRTKVTLWKADKDYYINKSGFYGGAFIRNDGEKYGPAISAHFTKIPKGRKIKITSTPNSQYTAGGPGALLDFQHGGTDFRLGKWQGYQYQDFEAVVDLGKQEEVKHLSAEFLQDVLSYIIMPTYVDFSVSTDSIHFKPVAHIVNTLPDTSMASTIKSLGADITPQKVRYIKVFAKNYGKLPPWHPGYGDEAFIFIDEIEIK